MARAPCWAIFCTVHDPKDRQASFLDVGHSRRGPRSVGGVERSLEKARGARRGRGGGRSRAGSRRRVRARGPSRRSSRGTRTRTPWGAYKDRTIRDRLEHLYEATAAWQRARGSGAHRRACERRAVAARFAPSRARWSPSRFTRPGDPEAALARSRRRSPSAPATSSALPRSLGRVTLAPRRPDEKRWHSWTER